MSSVFATIALLALVAAGLSTLVGWQRGIALAAPWVVIGIMGAWIAELPWGKWLQGALAIPSCGGGLSPGCGWVIFIGHVALVGWLLARRFFPRFTDERARSRARRAVDQERGRR